MSYTLEDWQRCRYGDSIKLINSDRMSNIFNRMSRFDVSYIDEDGCIAYSEGNPALDLIKLYKRDHFSYLHKKTEHWNVIDPYVDETGYFLNNCHKYKTSECSDVDYAFDGIFFLQAKLSSFDLFRLNHIKQWAKDNKKRIVFKKHPSNQTELNEKDFITDYTKFATEISAFDAVEQSDFAMSYSSASLMPALILGKKVLSIRKFDLSEIIPTGINPDMATPIHRDDVVKFLYWYKHIYCIDIQSKDFEHRVNRRIDMLVSGMKEHDIYESERIYRLRQE